MRRDDVVSLLDRIPLRDHPKIVFVLRGGVAAVSLDTVLRQEPEYLVVRGREAGTNDEGRAFFVPYDEISYVKIERMVRLNEVRAMYGEALVASTSLADEGEDDGPAAPVAATATAAAVTPAPAAPLDPAAIAKQNLLDRIRAARTGAGKPVGK